MLFRDLMNLFNRHNEQNRKPRTAEFYAAQLAKVADRYGHVDAVELRPYHLLELKGTWHLLMSVQRLYRWANEEAEILQCNPMAKMKRPRLGCRKRVLTERDRAILLRASRADFRRFLIASLEAAARPQELRELEWTDLRWPGGFQALQESLKAGQAYFELLEYKGRERRADPDEPRIIPVSPRLGRLLWRLARGKPLTGLVFLTDRDQAWTRNSLRLRMKRLRKRVDLPLSVKGERIVCYTMRHSSATKLATLGMQTSILQLLLGHASIRTTQRYLHFRKAHLIDAWREHCRKIADHDR